MSKKLVFISIILLAFGTAFAIDGTFGFGGSNVALVHALGYTGTGVNVGLISCRNVRSDHLAFNDANGVHVFNYDATEYYGIDYTGGGCSGHDTWVAGIIASRGWTGYESKKGVAYGCDLYSARVAYFTDVENALEQFINTDGCKVFVLPFQFPATSAYEQWQMLIDYYACNNDEVIFALAAGNRDSELGIYDVSIFGTAYNGITTGGLIDDCNGNYFKIGSLSLPASTESVRHKPDICAPAGSQTTVDINSEADSYTTSSTDGATSFSCPQTAGVAALLIQYANQNTEPYDNKAVVIKAAIVNSAYPNVIDKDGNFTAPAENTWNRFRGYGRLNAFEALQILQAGRIEPSDDIEQSCGWAYKTIYGYDQHEYYLKGLRNQRLLLTTAWHRKISRQYSYSRQCYTYSDNDNFALNLSVFFNGQEIYSETDTANNLKKADILLPTDGIYQIVLTNNTNKYRSYGLAFEFLEAYSGDYDEDNIVDISDFALLCENWLTDMQGNYYDLTGDCLVDFSDFVHFSANWFLPDRRYYNIYGY